MKALGSNIPRIASKETMNRKIGQKDERKFLLEWLLLYFST